MAPFLSGHGVYDMLTHCQLCRPQAPNVIEIVIVDYFCYLLIWFDDAMHTDVHVAFSNEESKPKMDMASFSAPNLTQPTTSCIHELNPHVHRMKSRRDKNTFNKINVISSTLMIFVTVLVDNYADVGQRYSSCCHFLPSVFLAHKPKFHPLQTPGNILNKHFASHFSV